jgi:hypothetical protein
MKDRVTIRKKKDGTISIRATGHKAVGVIMEMIQGERGPKKKRPEEKEAKKP